MHSLLSTIFPPHALHTGAAMAPFLSDQRGAFASQAAAVVMPTTTDQVQRLVALARHHRFPLRPQGGNTGLVGGSVGRTAATVIVNFSRMNQILAHDPLNYTVTVQAGCTVAAVKAALAQESRLLPIGLSVDYQCQIGGVLSTNAGGITVLRHGMSGELVLGLEVVSATGEVLSDLRALRKNNQGFDWKRLYIGSEGTLGLITAATLKTVPLPHVSATAWIGCDSLAAVLALYTKLKQRYDGLLEAFEVMNAASLSLVTRTRPELGPPPAQAAWHCLIRFTAGDAALLKVLDCPALIHDPREQEALWAWRSAIPWAQRDTGPSLKHDLSLPLSAWTAFITQGNALVKQFLPQATCVTFGHIGDGNLHYNIQTDTAPHPALTAALHDLTLHHGGSISAEHGVGLARRAEFIRTTPPPIVALGETIRQQLDPDGVLG